MDDSVNFQFWSSPILDLSLDSFSKEIFQEFDKSVIKNDSNSNITILNNQFMPKDSDVTPVPINVITTAEPTTPVNETSEHFIATSPSSSSSLSLPEEEDNEEEEEEKITPTNDITSPVMKKEEEVEDNTAPASDVPLSTNISRQNSSKSASSKVESPSDVAVEEDVSPDPADTGVVSQQQEQQQEQKQQRISAEKPIYTSRQVMTLEPSTAVEEQPAPKKSSFFCFSFC